MPKINATAIREALGHYSNYLRNLCAAPDQAVEDAFDALPIEVKTAALEVGRQQLLAVHADQIKRFNASQAELTKCINEMAEETVETLSEARVREELPALTDEAAVIGSIAPKNPLDADATGTP